MTLRRLEGGGGRRGGGPATSAEPSVKVQQLLRRRCPLLRMLQHSAQHEEFP